MYQKKIRFKLTTVWKYYFGAIYKEDFNILGIIFAQGFKKQEIKQKIIILNFVKKKK